MDKFNTSSRSSSPETETTCSPTNEGYVTDESNSSGATKQSNGTEANVQLRPIRKVSRSILKRASFWEKRCEQGLLSDSSVNEDFPAMDRTSYD
jgi:hypothetical protein